ncbi:MAG: bifunctional diaminohydroxyphosphoribosylaminopyrimidine deaminase/5-amino-6-(5-phosphoribosylamino)uracil reductase RibD [Elusimicrobiota bacterium]
MMRAIELGRLGMNNTSPNPRVGCVIVKNKKVIGEGYHTRFGGPHAETEAIESASAGVKDATMYVTLEPCSHQGKTPPCTERIIKEGISKVVIGIEDPDPVVSGIGRLKESGIEVICGIMEEEARELIRDYVEYQVNKKPFVTVKAALSWDGKIATKDGESRWVSGSQSRDFTMRLRGENDAILAGAGTVNKDDPELTYRMTEPAAKNPLRIVIDPRLSIDPGTKIIGENTVVFTQYDSDPEKIRMFADKNTDIVKAPCKNGRIDTTCVLDYLYERKMISLLVEGGGDTIGNFIDDGNVNRIIYIYAPIIIGGRDAPTACDGTGISSLKKALRLSGIKRFEIGSDIVMQGDIG